MALKSITIKKYSKKTCQCTEVKHVCIKIKKWFVTVLLA